MENMTLTTPALLFPAISLLLLAYTNRFLTLAQVIRQLHPGKSGPVTELAMRQLGGLKRRIGLIKLMQGFGVMSFLLCALSMFALFMELQTAGKVLFGLSLLALAVSLLVSLWEVLVSTEALNIVLGDMENRSAS
jgi:hypothetical protein